MIYRNLHVGDVSEVAGSATEERVDPVRWLPAVVLAVSAAYAVLRYVIVKEVAVAVVAKRVAAARGSDAPPRSPPPG